MSELAELLESLLHLVDSDVDLDGVHWSMKLDSRCLSTGPMLNVVSHLTTQLLTPTFNRLLFCQKAARTGEVDE